MDIAYSYIDSEYEATKVLGLLSSYNVLGVDIEATSLDPFDAIPLTIQIATPYKGYIFDVRKINPFLLKPLLESKHILKLLQNAKYDYKVLKQQCGIRLTNIYDTMLAEQLNYLGLAVKASLEHLALTYLDVKLDKTVRSEFINLYGELTERQKKYAALDAVVLFGIYESQLGRLKSNGLSRVAKLEFDFVGPLGDIELNGICIDSDKWLKLTETYEQKRAAIAKKLSEQLDKHVVQKTLFDVSPVNLNSPVQLLQLLKRMGLELPDTSDKTLKRFASEHPIIKDLLTYRKYSKIVTTYGKLFLKNIHPKTGRIHSDFKQLLKTGRVSCSSKYGAGLQQIKKDSDFRSSFIAEEGNDIITSDYSQMELRILAAYSNDKTFLDAFKHNEDLHSKVASVVFGVPIEKVKKDDDLDDHDPNKVGYRDKAKAINFGLCYGLTEFGLSIRLGCSVEQAAEIIENYFAGCPGVGVFLERTAEKAVENGYAESISGRKRFFQLPDANDKDADQVINSIKRKAKNMPIQGSNADIIKKAITKLTPKLESFGAKIVHTVHDEVVVESPKQHSKNVKQIIDSVLVESFQEYFDSVPIKTDTVIRPFWSKK